MESEFFKIVGIIIVVGYLIYLAIKSLTLQSSIMEGLTNNQTTTANDQAVFNNKGSGAQSYANKIQQIQQDAIKNLDISNNRTDYENVIIQMDDLINATMLKTVMSINKTDLKDEGKLIDVVEKINKLNDGKKSLNSIMKFIDGM